MIVAFEGTPGSGKTYDAVREICNNLKLGRNVYTNVEGMELPDCQRFLQDFCGLDDYQFKSKFHWLSDIEISHFWDLKTQSELNGVVHESPFVTDGSLLVIDEIHKIFSNRNWRADENRIFADWASTHRHHGFDVYFVTQSLTKIDSHLRSLIEWTYVYRKVNFLGGFSKNRYLKYAYTGDDTHGKPLNTISRCYDLDVFRCYKSMVNDTNVKMNIMPQVNILKHPVFFIIPILLVFFLYMFFGKSSFATGDLFGTEKIAHKFDQKKDTPTSPVPGPPPPVRPSPPVPAPVPPALPPGVPPGAVIGSGPGVSAPVVVSGILVFDRSKRYLLSDGRVVSSKQNYIVSSQFKEESP